MSDMKASKSEQRSRALRLYEAIVEYKSNNDGNSPSYREMADMIEIGSTSVVATLLESLQDDGLVTVQDSDNVQPRSVRINGGVWTLRGSPVSDNSLLGMISSSSGDRENIRWTFAPSVTRASQVLESLYRQAGDLRVHVGTYTFGTEEGFSILLLSGQPVRANVAVRRVEERIAVYWGTPPQFDASNLPNQHVRDNVALFDDPDEAAEHIIGVFSGGKRSRSRAKDNASAPPFRPVPRTASTSAMALATEVARKFSLDGPSAQKIADAVTKAQDEGQQQIDNALQLIDHMIGGFGVWRFTANGREVGKYVGRGDDDVRTVAFDHDASTFLLVSLNEWSREHSQGGDAQ